MSRTPLPGLIIGALAGCAATAAIAQSPAITASSTTRDVHDAYIIPGSDALFAAEQTPPETDEDWAALAAAAQQVIDGANLLTQGDRPPGSSDWLMHAGAVVDATKVTQSDAIEAQVADEFVFTNGDMMAGCTACHQQFRNP